MDFVVMQHPTSEEVDINVGQGHKDKKRRRRKKEKKKEKGKKNDVVVDTLQRGFISMQAKICFSDRIDG